MNIFSSILVLVAIVISFVTLFALIGWLRGAENILLPGLGLVISIPALIILLLILNTGFIIIAAVVRPARNAISHAETGQNVGPDDIFSGCGNGVLDLSVVHDPNHWGDNSNDRNIGICINDDDLESIFDLIAPGRMKYADQQGEDYQKFVDNNQKILERATIKYPQLGKSMMFMQIMFSAQTK